MILEASPDSPALVRTAATAILYLHIAGGTAGIVSGMAALALRKGGHPHRLVGNVFFVSMLIMATIGAAVSPFLPKPQWANVFMGVLTCYLLVTSRMAIRNDQGGVSRFEYGAFGVAATIAIGALLAGTLALNMPNGRIGELPYQVALGFAPVWALLAAADLKLILRGGVFGTQRLVRHLWRMCVALLIAVLSLFVGQPQVFPESIRGTGFRFVPELLVLGALVFWLLRVQRMKRSTPTPPDIRQQARL